MEKLIAITPSHWLDPQIAIAACRAQGLGILDLGYRNAPLPLAPLLERLAAACADRAARWDTLGLPQRGLDRLAQHLPRPVPVLVLAGLSPADWLTLRKQTKRLARQLLIEVHDLPTARAVGHPLPFLGQGVAFAPVLAKRHGIVGRILPGRNSVAEFAHSQQTLTEDALLSIMKSALAAAGLNYCRYLRKLRKRLIAFSSFFNFFPTGLLIFGF